MSRLAPAPSPISTPQSTIISHVPSRAKSIDQILDYAEKNGITNEILIKIGLRMNANLLFGSNNRCVAMLIMFKSIEEPLKENLKRAMDFLNFCRPLSFSMTNAYEFVREEMLKLSQNIAKLRLDDSNQQDDNLEEQKSHLNQFIDRFIEEEIWSAQKGICENISSIMMNHDVILVYGCSTLVQHILLHAKTKGKTFRVIVVDAPPHFNGRRMSSFLHDNCIDVSYTLINSLSFVIRQVKKVLLGANSILANGYVMSHIGSSQVALMAKASNVPTLVCCETYKLSDRVHVDSFGCNEIDSGHELDSAINLRYDLIPPEFVSMVINEKNIVPAESVPALLRFRTEKTNKASSYAL